MHDFSSRREEFPFGGSGGSSPRDSRARRRSKQRFDDDEPTTFKRVRGRRALPPIEDWDATDGLPEGDRWSTWDQTKNLITNATISRSGHTCRSTCPALPGHPARYTSARMASAVTDRQAGGTSADSRGGPSGSPGATCMVSGSHGTPDLTRNWRARSRSWRSSPWPRRRTAIHGLVGDISIHTRVPPASAS